MNSWFIKFPDWGYVCWNSDSGLCNADVQDFISEQYLLSLLGSEEENVTLGHGYGDVQWKFHSFELYSQFTDTLSILVRPNIQQGNKGELRGSDRE